MTIKIFLRLTPDRISSHDSHIQTKARKTKPINWDIFIVMQYLPFNCSYPKYVG